MAVTGFIPKLWSARLLNALDKSHVFANVVNRDYEFQSTPSVGRATAKIYKYTILRLYIVHIKLYIFATAVLFT